MMHEIWSYVPKRLLVSDKTHVTVFDHRKQAVCGAGMPKNHKRGDSAVLPFVYSLVDCGHCLTILSCHPQNTPLVKWHMFPRAEHTELPKNRWGHHPSCRPHRLKDVKIVSSGSVDYCTVQFACTMQPKPRQYPHQVTYRCVWPETVNSWW